MRCCTITAAELLAGISASAVSTHSKFASSSSFHAPLCSRGIVGNTVLCFTASQHGQRSCPQGHLLSGKRKINPVSLKHSTIFLPRAHRSFVWCRAVFIQSRFQDLWFVMLFQLPRRWGIFYLSRRCQLQANIRKRKTLNPSRSIAGALLKTESQVWVCALRLIILFLRKLFSYSVELSMLSLFHLSLQWWLGRQVRCDRWVSAWSRWWNNDQAPVSWREMVWWLLPAASARNQSPKSMVSGILAAQVPVPFGRVFSREP